jgi:YcaO-like protein with predicted kinase domain
MEIKGIDSLLSPLEIKKSIEEIQIIQSNENGSRNLKSEDALPLAIKAAQYIGISRIEKISPLIDSELPIYSSTRVRLQDHHLFATIGNSLGKGLSDTQSRISCLMETIEQYCAEDRNTHFIKASYNFLSKVHLTSCPQYYIRLFKDNPFDLDEKTLWAEAYSPLFDDIVYVPAQCIFFPLDCESYGVRSFFPSGSNGLASGFSYIEAIIHGLYEVIERAFVCSLEVGLGFQTEINLNGFLDQYSSFLKFKNQKAINFYILETLTLEAFPIVRCNLTTPRGEISGFGCDSNIEIAITRAFTEAIQCYAALESSTREEIFLSKLKDNNNIFDSFPYLNRRNGKASEDLRTKSIKTIGNTVTLQELREMFPASQFANLNEEYKNILSYLKQNGHENFYIANLTRNGVNIPVVKVIVPSLISLLKMYSYNNSTASPSRINKYKYRTN